MPAIGLYEVFRVIIGQRGEDAAIEAVAAMRQGRVVDLDDSTTLTATQLDQTFKLPLADAVIPATARIHAAVVRTQDSHFAGLEGFKDREAS